MRIWLDDKREMPPEFDVHIMSAFDAIALIKTGVVTGIGLDHDLSDETIFGNGHMVSDFIEEQAYFNKIPRIDWSIQSSNGPEVARMSVALRRADVYWQKHEEGKKD
jgi:hypothetical protein